MSSPSPVCPVEGQINLLAEAVLNKPPYRSGTSVVPKDYLILYYGKDSHAKRLDFSTATDEKIQHLAQSCDAATFGMNEKNVLDESYRKAGKLDSDHFLTSLDVSRSGLMDIVTFGLLEDLKETRRIRSELYKLNVYGPGSFFKAHKDTPRSENMFGSLVIVLPTRHEGGTLLFNHKGESWSFDSAKAIQDSADPSSTIAYATFFSDVEHEVTPVRSGYRVTITYNLYFEDNASPASIHDKLCESEFYETLQRQLKDPSFFPDGVCLGFGLHHQYPLNNESGKLDHLFNCVKGSDAAILQACQALSLHVSFNIVYKHTWLSQGDLFALSKRHIVEEGFILDGDERLINFLCEKYGAKIIGPVTYKFDDDEPRLEAAFDVHWVTKMNEMTTHRVNYVAYGNQHEATHSYGDVCLIAAVGPYGRRTEPPKTFIE